MIIIPLSSSFGTKCLREQQEIVGLLECAAHDAGLAGKVCAVWAQGRKMGFLAPTPWHAFFSSISYAQIAASVNKRLTVNLGHYSSAA